MEMNIQDYYYDLPSALIAQTPLADRTASRLLVMDRRNGAMTHQRFSQLVEYLNPGDCLVLNNTKVIPARLFGVTESGGTAELLLLKRLDASDPAVQGDTWETLAKPGKRVREGAELVFGDGLLIGHVDRVLEDGNRLVTFRYEGIFEEILDELGEMPLPPYIKETLADKDRYQTVYAMHDGSAAAPTAGLHFNTELLQALREKGVAIAYITLHVGLGTFRPVKTQNIKDHAMHAEYFHIEQSQAEIINHTKKTGGRIIAVGTTSTRTLEANTRGGLLCAGQGWTDIFIYPGYDFQCIDGLITNFHLPESTLIMLVSAFAGREATMQAYDTAVSMEYRFFSFGDAMLVI